MNSKKIILISLSIIFLGTSSFAVELLIRTKNKPNDLESQEAYLRGRHVKGDVICIVPDNWEWSDSERNGTNTMILRLPAIDANIVYNSFNFFEPQTDPNNNIIRPRRYGIDVDSITPEIKGAIEDKRGSAISRLNLLNNLIIDKTK